MPRVGSTTAVERLIKLQAKINEAAPEITRRISVAADENQGDEAGFRALFTQVIEPWAQALDIPLLARAERTLATGRADATYNRLVIEYEAPGRLREDLDHAATAHAIRQAKDYVEGVANQDRQAIHRFIGVVFDGYFFIYVRNVDGFWTEPELERVHQQSVARFLRLLVSLTSGKALLPDNLIQDFGTNTIYAQRIASSLHEVLSERLDEPQVNLVEKLFEQWQTFFGEVTGFEEGSHPLRNRPELRHFSRGMGIEAKDVVPSRLFFTVHTYFALLIKLIAYYALSRFVPDLGERFGSLHTLNDEDLKHELEDIEGGGMFRQLGIRNFLEGDFFKWYLYAWDSRVAKAIRTLLDRLKDYDPGTLEVSPEQARDLLKKLYHRLLPREIRHDLGEYYTPDWLAEHVLDELGYEGQIDKRLLDPACGSGTFLVLAISRLKDRCLRDGIDERKTLEIILDNIVGIDLNPLAAIAARTNYLLALGNLLAHRNQEIDIPVYLADSILTPARGRELFNQDRYEISTVVGQLDIPSCIKTQDQIANLFSHLEICVEQEIGADVFLGRAKVALGLADYDWNGEDGRGPGARVILGELFAKLTKLHEEGLNGIWARILQNAFMPLFLGRFHFIAGNPPWVNWRSLPEDYRKRTSPLWQEYNLFPHTGFAAKLGAGQDDISVLMLYIALNEFAEDDGKLAFLVTQSLFKSAGGGKGFRRFMIRSTTPLQVQRVADLSSFQPFDGVTNRTGIVMIQKGQSTQYPVPYDLWQKLPGSSISSDSTLTEVKSAVRILQYSAVPIDAHEATSPWITGPSGATAVVRDLAKPSSFHSRIGIKASRNAVFWVDLLHEREDGRVVIQNHIDGAKAKVRSVTVDLEPDLIYPMLRGRDVRKWIAHPSLHIIVTHREDAGLSAIPETEMQKSYPRTYSYLKLFEQELRGSGVIRRYFTRRVRGRQEATGPFYSMFNVGPYSFSKYKVVFREISTNFQAAVVVPSANKPVVADHKLVLIDMPNELAADYLAGILNSKIIQYLAASYSISTQFSTHLTDYIWIPPWDHEDNLKSEIAGTALIARKETVSGDDIAVAVAEQHLDKLVAQLYGINDNVLQDIGSWLDELRRMDLHEQNAPEHEEEDQT